MNGNNFFIIDVGNTDIVIALIKDFQIYKIKRYKTIDFRNKKLLLFKKFNRNIHDMEWRHVFSWRRFRCNFCDIPFQ